MSSSFSFTSLVDFNSWVSHLVLAETSWVLDSVYNRTSLQIANAIDRLPDDVSSRFLYQALR